MILMVFLRIFENEMAIVEEMMRMMSEG